VLSFSGSRQRSQMPAMVSRAEPSRAVKYQGCGFSRLFSGFLRCHS